MLKKWKVVINDWLCCYIQDVETVKHVDHKVISDSIMSIISPKIKHLFQSVKFLDLNKVTSPMEIKSLEQLILAEKPGFKFSLMTNHEIDVYITLSLLLFIICVKENEVSINSRLHREHQDIIHKFCHTIKKFPSFTYMEIQMAITEACGLEIATVGAEDAISASSSEKSQMLWPNHECGGFDYKNLQEELVATNLRLEKLVAHNKVNTHISEEQTSEQQSSINFLKNQFSNIQDKINKQIRRNEINMQFYHKKIVDQENEIFNLKHRINEEIEEKQILKAEYSDETSKLNNEINELEQKIKDNCETSRQAIEEKMQDIQTLQEQKLSLLQSLTNEITKLNNTITKLKSDIDKEQRLKENVRDWYDYKLMRLNEKVLNRNNELVELQDGIFEKGETIENLKIELKKEKELSKRNSDELLCFKKEKEQAEDKLRLKVDEMLTLQRNYEQKIAKLLSAAENSKLVYPNECSSKKQFLQKSRKRSPLQDASNFNDSHITHSIKENYDINMLK